MGRSGRRSAFAGTVGSLLLLQLSWAVDVQNVLEPTLPIDNGSAPSRTSGMRRLLSGSSAGLPEGVRLDLIHRDHKDSPLRSGSSEDLTFAERLALAVLRSNNRAKLLGRTLGNVGQTTTDFESSVAVGNGEYIMDLELGTPAKKYSVIVDTGSDLTWIQCSPCSTCFRQPSPLFDPSNSSSYRALECSDTLCQTLPVVETCSPSCQYFYEYGDQSTTVGVFSRETVTLSSTNGIKQQVGDMAFGCGHDNQGSFSGVDGLIGLGQGPISFTSQLSSLFSNKFSYCLVSMASSSSQTSPMFFGGAAVPSGTVQYTPIVKNSFHSTYYYVGLTGISVGGTLLSIPVSSFAIDSSGSGGTILDSGTTITQLVNGAYRVVVQAFQSLMHYPQVKGSPSGLDICFDVTGVSSIQVPTLEFHFVNADINLPAENYFVTVDNAGTLCLAMAGSYGFSIFGNIQQQNYQVLYDRAEGRIGFKKIQCNAL